MAVADSTKPSPSKQPVTETTTTTDSGGGGGGGNGTAGATEKAAAAAAAASTRRQETLYAVTGTGRGPTYADTEESVYFLRAKGYLSRGQFERALSAIEKGIEDTKSKLHTTDRDNGNDNDDNDDNEDDDGATTTTATFALHESLAPFHYLYATTLLYSLEELPADRPTDTNNTIDEEEEKSNKEDSVVEETEAAAAAESMNNKMADFQAIAQDMQIAWENFEIARTSIEAMISERQQESPSSSSSSSSFVEKLKLDLSKVYLRKGDLQSASGNFDAAVRDYTSSLVLRQGSTVLERFDRAVADVQYNLGLAYIMLATSSETSGGVTGGTGGGGSSPGDDDNNDNENDDDDDDDDKENDEGAENATAATAAAADNVAALPPPPSGTKQKQQQPATETAAAEVRQLHRKRSSYNFLECGRTLCGKIALLCNADPDQVLRQQQQMAATNHGTAGGAGAGTAAGAASAAASASDGGSDRLDEPAVAAKKLHHLRKYVATALKPAAGNENDVTEFRQVLDEIQATMDATGAVVD